jgi:hypothetical protein
MRKLLIGLLAVALVLFGALLPLVLPRHCPVNRGAFERIEEGMTQAEVEAILGGPPGDYRTQPPAPSRATVRVWENWEGDEGTVFIWFSSASGGLERVMSANFYEAEPYTPGLVELIRWRLWRLKERLLP